MELVWRLALVAALCCGAALGQQQIRRAQQKCAPERRREMDECAARLGFLGDRSFVVPTNSSQMEGFCAQLQQSIGCLQSYARDCLQGFSKQLLASLLKRGKQQHNSICQPLGTARTEFMAQLACLAGDKISHLHACMDASIARFELIARQPQADAKLPGLCCSYQIFFADISQTMARLCGAGGGPSSAPGQFVQKLVAGTTAEFLQLICDGHRSMAECRASRLARDLVPKLERATRLSKAGKLRNRSKSLIPPLLEILEAASART